MRNESHKSWTKIVSEAVNAWREREGWSRETVCQQFVEEFEVTEAPNAWNIEFSNHADVFQRQKNNADKIMRWLDDVNKDTNLLGFNFSRVILRRLPMDLRMGCFNEMMAPMGLCSRGIDKVEVGALNATTHLVRIARETSEAQSAVANLIDGATPAELATADRELAEAEEAIHAARVEVHLQLKVAG